MLLQQLKITGLFNQFDYTIDFNSEENITILTGANGCGKTVILNIIYSLHQSDTTFFEKLVFSKIELVYENNNIVEVFKYENVLRLKVRQGNTILMDYASSQKWAFPSDLKHLLIDTYFIKEQRLFLFDNFSVKETIKKFAEDLVHVMGEKRYEMAMKLEELNATFTQRLLEEEGTITETEFYERNQQIIKKQKQLFNYGLLNFTQVLSEYSQKNAKVLLVYLNDLERKISIMDDLLERIELFTSILNTHRLSFKSIQIDTFKGFQFINNQQQELQVSDLSSGEQHEVVLLYELIFNTPTDSLVLIDEPEISLHVAWQNEFLNDLRKIIKLKKIYAIVATHSPQIIDEYWDLTVNLNKQIV
jgi:predicted ATP-binding protein involved in virulence